MKNHYFVKSNQEFQEIIGLKQSIANKTYIIYKRENDLGYHRFGLSVGKKVGNAVLRNKIKRQLRHILREINIKTAKGYDIIIIVKKSILEKSFDVRKRDLVHALKISKVNNN